jgi:hypothetical protein
MAGLFLFKYFVRQASPVRLRSLPQNEPSYKLMVLIIGSLMLFSPLLCIHEELIMIREYTKRIKNNFSKIGQREIPSCI